MVKQHENDSSTRIHSLPRLDKARKAAPIRWDKVYEAREKLENGTLDTPEVWQETLRRFAADR